MHFNNLRLNKLNSENYSYYYQNSIYNTIGTALLSSKDCENMFCGKICIWV